MWSMQVGTNLTHFEVTALEETWFVMCETWKCALWPLIVNESTTIHNWPVEFEAWPKIHNNKPIQQATMLKFSTL
jgi:hypothetical protein